MRNQLRKYQADKIHLLPTFPWQLLFKHRHEIFRTAQTPLGRLLSLQRVCSQKLPAGTARRTAPFAHYQFTLWMTGTSSPFQNPFTFDWHFPGKGVMTHLFFRNWRLLEGFALECQRPPLYKHHRLRGRDISSAGETKTKKWNLQGGCISVQSPSIDRCFFQLQGLL